MRQNKIVLTATSHRYFYNALLIGAMFVLPVSLFCQEKIRKTVFIIADGIPADVIEKLPVNNLHAIAGAGGYARSYVGGLKGTYSETPTISAVGYNSVLTGTWVNKHNVWDNDIAEPNYHYPTIFRLFKEQYPHKKIGIFSSWQDNRTKLVGDDFAATGNLTVDNSYDGLEKDTVHYPHDAEKKYMSAIDEAVAKEAAEVIQTTAPDLSWVYLEYTDDMGHMYGDSPQFYNAVQLADKRIGYIWKAIQYRQAHFNEDWLIIITTDHGRDAATGKGHGGQSARERDSWIFTNAKNLNQQFRAPQTAAVDIMPSIARFMNVSLARDINFETDGTAFIGPLSFNKPVFSKNGNTVNIAWRAIAVTGNVKIFLAETNLFKTGGKDNYTLLRTVPLTAQQAMVRLPVKPGTRFKLVIQGDSNTSNVWLEQK